jgi:peptide/nickel transport system ATP-binding protein
MTRLLELEGLTVRFAVGGRGQFVTAVDNASLAVSQNEVVGLVGESGCGKSTLARTIVGLHRPASGRVLFKGQDVTALRGANLRAYRRRVQYVFQDPYSSLSPRLSVSAAIEEPLIIHGMSDRTQRGHRVSELLDLVGLPESVAGQRPAGLSGGQRQRVAIARALAVRPELLICDEPVSALDVSIRAQIMNLFLDLQQSLGIGMLFIAHDLGLVRRISDRVAVMYLGSVVEEARADDLFEAPAHPYSSALLAATPTTDPDVERGREHVRLRGELPSPINLPTGCRFHTRCPHAIERCVSVAPRWTDLGGGRHASCHLVDPEVPEERHVDAPTVAGPVSD